jgi:hypothetical protein
MAVAATLHTSLVARFDRLGPAANESAQVAAVIGRLFSYELPMPVAQKSEPDLRSALDRLGDAGLVFCRGVPPQATFLFKHALVRDAAYGTLLRGRRQALHACVVATLEQQFPDMVMTEPERLAQHCAEGGLAEKAIQYRLAASRRTLVRSATAEAVAQLRNGLALLSGVGEDGRRLEHEPELQTAFGRALMATMGHASCGGICPRPRAVRAAAIAAAAGPAPFWPMDEHNFPEASSVRRWSMPLRCGGWRRRERSSPGGDSSDGAESAATPALASRKASRCSIPRIGRSTWASRSRTPRRRC